MAPSTGDASEEDDYLTMTFEDATPNSKTETLTQRKKRLAREAEERARPKSKAQVAEEERRKREEALNKSGLDTKSKGFKMMAALGYKPGTALGVERKGTADGDKDDRLLDPIGLEMREDRSGIGADAEKKRKIREAFEQQEEAVKKHKVDEGDFRERQMKEREEKRMEGQLWGAMKVAERLDEEEEEEEEEDETIQTTGETVADAGEKRNDKRKNKKTSSKPLRSTNVLWRGLVKQRLLNERDRRMRYDLNQSLSRRADYNDPEEDKEDQMALGKKDQIEEVGLDIDQNDSELEQFETLEISERLDKLIRYLRNEWHYCFWCKHRYEDDKMEGCPGVTEDDHD